MDLKNMGGPGRGPVLNFGKTGGAAATPATPVRTALWLERAVLFTFSCLNVYLWLVYLDLKVSPADPTYFHHEVKSVSTSA